MAARKVKRPTKGELVNLIQNLSWCAIGRKYGVSDNAVRKWARQYGLETWSGFQGRAVLPKGCTMLVLSRQRDEVILIGDDVRLKVVDIRGDKVRLGFEAPKDVQIHREEVWLKIKEQEKQEKD